MSFSDLNFANAKSKQKVTIYGDAYYRPYTYEENGKSLGIYTRILETAFSRMKDYEIDIHHLPWKRAHDSLRKGEIFAIFPPYYKPLKRPWIGAYSLPILTEEIVVFTRKEILTIKDRPHWPEDWYGLKIGIFAGTDIAGEKFNQAVMKGKIFKEEAKGTEENLLKLANGRVDAYVNDYNAIFYTINDLKKRGKWPKNAPELAKGASIISEKGHLALTNNTKKYPYRDDFLKKFNSILEQMQATGEDEKIIQEVLEGKN